MDKDIVIQAQGLCKQYRVYGKPADRLKQALLGKARSYFQPFDALKGIDLTVKCGETIGIVGRNGSGKSTLLQLICGTLTPTQGSVEVKGKIAALLELGSGFNPEFSGQENVFLNAAIHGFSRAETEEKYDAIVRFSGLSEEQLKQPVKTYSSGMVVRLAFSVAISVEPDLLIVDEALAVGDAGFQRKCFARIRELQERGASILFVSHSAQSVIELCDRAILLDGGEKLCEGEPKDIITGYHRLVYAPPEARPKIREQLQAGKLLVSMGEDDEEVVSGINPDRDEYHSEYGKLDNYYLTDLENNIVTTCETGKRYRLHYTIHAHADLYRPKCGMLIKSKRGAALGGAVLKHLYHSDSTLKEGESRTLCYEFDCSLLPETYFINCGFMHQQGEDESFVHRIIDAIEFRVMRINGDADITPAGQLDLNITVSGLT